MFVANSNVFPAEVSVEQRLTILQSNKEVLTSEIKEWTLKLVARVTEIEKESVEVAETGAYHGKDSKAIAYATKIAALTEDKKV